jgi:hypothetical protein
MAEDSLTPVAQEPQPDDDPTVVAIDAQKIGPSCLHFGQ